MVFPFSGIAFKECSYIALGGIVKAFFTEVGNDDSCFFQHCYKVRPGTISLCMTLGIVPENKLVKIHTINVR